MRHSVYRGCKFLFDSEDLRSELAPVLKIRLKYGELQPGDCVISRVEIEGKWVIQEELAVNQFIHNYS